MALLGLPRASLAAFALRCPEALPLLLKARLARGEVAQLRGAVQRLGGGTEAAML